MYLYSYNCKTCYFCFNIIRRDRRTDSCCVHLIYHSLDFLSFLISVSLSVSVINAHTHISGLSHTQAHRKVNSWGLRDSQLLCESCTFLAIFLKVWHWVIAVPKVWLLTALQPMSTGAEESHSIVLKTLEACVCGWVCKRTVYYLWLLSVYTQNKSYKILFKSLGSVRLL